MSKTYRATETFGTVLMWQGSNIQVHWEKGDERECEDWQVELLARDCPGSLVEVKVSKPKVEKPKAETKVETKAGPTDDAKTRAVTDAPKRTRRTGKAKG